jgi:hypothetical protein
VPLIEWGLNAAILIGKEKTGSKQLKAISNRFVT